MTDSLEQFLQDIRFDVPAGLVDGAKAAAILDAAGSRGALGGARPRRTRPPSRNRSELAPPRHQWALAVVAALLAIAIVATLVGIRVLRISAPIPARHGLPTTLHKNGQIVFGDGNTLFAIDPATRKRRAILFVYSDPACVKATTRAAGPAGDCVLLSDAVYSPNGNRLAYIKSAGYGSEPTIWIFDAGTRQSELLTTCTPPGCGRSSYLTWSPDGSRLAFSDSDGHGGVQVYLIDADGAHRTQLTHLPSGQYASQPTWSPNGINIAFSLSTGPFGQLTNCGYDCARLAPATNIAVINADGSGLSVILADVKQQDGLGNLDPTWSPDGSRIAYVLNLSLVGGLSAEEQLWLMDPDGSHRTKVFMVTSCCDQGGPAWSPDGKQFAFAAIPDHCSLGCVSDLFVMNADGSQPRNMGGIGFGDRPAWQPLP